MSKQSAFPRIRAAVLREFGKSPEPVSSWDATITVLVVVGGAGLVVMLVALASAWVTGDWGLPQ